MSDEPELDKASKTETTVRHFDADDKLISETVTVVVHKAKPDSDAHTGMYL